MQRTVHQLAGSILATLVAIVLATTAAGAGLAVEADPKTGWDIYRIEHGDTQVRLVPAAGFNVISWTVKGQELLRQPPELAEAPGVGYGVPLLYPTPNRVRGAAFEFEGQRYEFPDNDGGNFIHGLVHSVSWDVVGIRAQPNSTEVTGQLEFGGTQQTLDRFSLPHQLRVVLLVTDGSIRWTYEVDNRASKRAIPFGFALHPYFNYLSPRDSMRIRIPATHLMESVKLLPTGKLLPLAGHPLDARAPRKLSDLKADDVYFGMLAAEPTEVEYPSQNWKLVLQTSPEFTHLVLYTPDAPYFCVENQTCPTDAHNLDAAGQRDVAHLQICPSGQQRSGWVEYRIEPLQK